MLPSAPLSVSEHKTFELGDARAHSRLLTSICLAMGLNDVNFFGDRDLKTHANYQGPLPPPMV